MKTGKLLGVVTVLSTMIVVDAQADLRRGAPVRGRAVMARNDIGRTYPVRRTMARNDFGRHYPLRRTIARNDIGRHYPLRRTVAHNEFIGTSPARRALARSEMRSGYMGRRALVRNADWRSDHMGGTSTFVTTTRQTTWRTDGLAPTFALAGTAPVDSTFVEPIGTTTWRRTRPIRTFAVTGTEPVASTTFISSSRPTGWRTRPIRTFAVTGTEPLDSDFVEPIRTTTWRTREPVRTFALTGTAPEVVTDVVPTRRTVVTTRVVRATTTPNFVSDRRLVNARIVADSWRDRRVDYRPYRVSRDIAPVAYTAYSRPADFTYDAADLEPAPIAEAPIITTRRVAIARPVVVAPTIALAGSSTVVSAQERLADAGYLNGPISGVVDAPTRSAILRYERDNGLPRIATINEPLMISLGLQ